MKTILYAFILTMVGGLALADSLSDDLLPSYFTIQQSLAKDTTKGITPSAQKIVEKTRKYLQQKETPKTLGEIVQRINETAAKLLKANLKEARESFKSLSQAMIQLQEKAPGNKGVVIFYCPMAKAAWMQDSKETANPYYGSSMLKCGKIITPKKSEGDTHHNHHKMDRMSG